MKKIRIILQLALQDIIAELRKKRFGFTLAEVLITLAIIGVVA